MENINHLLRALRAETIKMKNTLGVWTAIIFPVFVVFMNFMIYLNRPKMLLNPKTNPWIVLFQNAVTIYSILFLPLFIAIITFYINFSEHKSNAWRQIYSLPVPKSSVYYSKFILSFLIVSASILFFYLLNYFSIIILKVLKPEIPFNAFSLEPIVAVTFLKIALASAGITAIQFVISILSGNFIYPLGFGLLATFAGAFLNSWEKIIYYPYSYPFQAAMDMIKNNYTVINLNLILSIGTALVFVLLGAYLHNRVRIK